jgi:hypothetical protein
LKTYFTFGLPNTSFLRGLGWRGVCLGMTVSFGTGTATFGLATIFTFVLRLIFAGIVIVSFEFH